eukprot:jgi/Ulvmu1/2362/UM013_0210.1
MRPSKAERTVTGAEYYPGRAAATSDPARIAQQQQNVFTPPDGNAQRPSNPPSDGRDSRQGDRGRARSEQRDQQARPRQSDARQSATPTGGQPRQYVPGSDPHRSGGPGAPAKPKPSKQRPPSHVSVNAPASGHPSQNHTPYDLPPPPQFVPGQQQQAAASAYPRSAAQPGKGQYVPPAPQPHPSQYPMPSPGKHRSTPDNGQATPAVPGGQVEGYPGAAAAPMPPHMHYLATPHGSWGGGAAMEPSVDGYAPAVVPDFKALQEEREEPEMDPTLRELNDTYPSFIASIICKCPSVVLLLLLVFFLAAAAAAALPAFRPIAETNFDTLQIKDHPVAARSFAVDTLEDENSFYMQQPAPAASSAQQESPRGGPTGGRAAGGDGGEGGDDADAGDDSGDAAVDDAGGDASGEDGGGEDGDEEDGDERRERDGGRRLLSGMEVDVAAQLPRDAAWPPPFGGRRRGRALTQFLEGSGVTRTLAVFYRFANGATAINPDLVSKARSVEQKLMDHPDYERICARDNEGKCLLPFSFATLVFSTQESLLTGGFEIGDEQTLDVPRTAKALVEGNFTYFFDIDSDGVDAQWLRTIILFAEQPGDKTYEDRMVDDLIDLFDDEQSDSIIINYGENTINTRQINQQINEDLYWAVLSMFFAAIMLRLGSGSWFMTIAGIFQIIVSFPIAWLVYARPRDWEYVTFIHFLAPFVILGIGLDDIFVTISFFQNTRPFMGHFALDTRLTHAFSKASGAMLATSTTSAFAFAANVFSPVPAIQSFGLLLAVLVIVNYVLAVTWLPVCLAVWDYHIEFPRRAREAAGRSTCCSCTLLRCCCLGDSHSAGTAAPGGGAATLRIVHGGQVPRALEFKQVVLPFYKPKRVTAEIARHRLLQPDRPNVVIPMEELRQVAEANSYVCCGHTFDMRRYIGLAFDGIFRIRWLAIAACLVVTLMGVVGTVRLESPPTSEPPLFESDHNVQFFFKYSSSKEADNLPACMACVADEFDTFGRKDEVIENPEDFFDPSQPLFSTQRGGLSTVLADLVWGIEEGGIDNTPNVQGDPAAEPVDNILTYQVEQPSPQPLDFSDRDTQIMIRNIMGDLFQDIDNSVPRAGREGIVSFIARNPMNALREYCNPGSTTDGPQAEDAPEPNLPTVAAEACSRLDPETQLPTGRDFQIVAFTFLATTEEGTRWRDFMGYTKIGPGGRSAFDFLTCTQTIDCDPPELAWVRYQVRTATGKGDKPEDIQRSSEIFSNWAVAVQQDYAYKGMFASSKSWVTAVTYVEISESVYGTVFLSIGLAAAVVFVFTGFRMMVFAAITVLMINVTVMGVLYTWGWTLGAVEGMSITSLVGLSVDFCIHITEAHVHARSQWRPDDATAKLKAGGFSWLCNPNPLGKLRAREALVLVAVPMVASAVSTVITTTPLFAATTLILKRFSAVIFVTMIVGLAYVLLFLTPVLAMFGPGKARQRDKTMVPSYWKVLVEHILNSKAVRLFAVIVLMLIAMNLIPSTRESIVAGDALGDFVALLLALAVVAFVVIIAHAFIRAAQHYRDFKLEAKEANAAINARREEHLHNLQARMAKPFVPQDRPAAI